MTQEDVILSNDIEEFDFSKFKEDAINKLKEGKSLIGEDGIMTPIIQQIVNASLEAELDFHISQCKENKISNRKNGKSTKTLKTSSGLINVESSRDRNGTFQPKIVKKRQTILSKDLDSKILSLFRLGMSYQDIRNNLKEIYGIDVSQGMITQVTDSILPTITEWRSRPLEEIYAIVFLDAMFFKARDSGKVINKTVYNIIGINQEGKKEVLGFYTAESEGANFWLGVLNDLKARGVKDILIACIDGLTGFPEAIAAAFPKTEIQLCIVHQIRHSLKYVASKDKKPFMDDLKLIYRAENKDLAEQRLLELEEKWGKKYPAVLRSWNNKWDELSNYFKYSDDIRRLVYTTNPIEGFHRQIRKYTKSKGSFTSENALYKLIYSACDLIQSKWTQPIHNWSTIISQLDIYFEGRLKLEL